MARVVNQHLVDQEALEQLKSPRVDWLVAETPDGDGFGFSDGPFTHWRRTIEVADNPGADADKGLVAVTETIEYTLALPVWRFGATPLISWQLRRPHRVDAPFWAPPERFDAKGSQSFALLIFAALAAAYLGTLLSQTITFVAEEFDVAEIYSPPRIARRAVSWSQGRLVIRSYYRLGFHEEPASGHRVAAHQSDKAIAYYRQSAMCKLEYPNELELGQDGARGSR